MCENTKWLIELIADVATILIAALALGLTIWQARATQRHNEATLKHSRLSIRPLIVLTRLFSDRNEENGLFFENTGIGPGNVSNIRVSIDGKQAVPVRSPQDIESFIRQHVRGSFPRITFFVPGRNYYLRSGEKLGFFTFDIRSFDTTSSVNLKNFLFKIQIAFEYSSLYEESWSYDSQEREPHITP